MKVTMLPQAAEQTAFCVALEAPEGRSLGLLEPTGKLAAQVADLRRSQRLPGTEKASSVACALPYRSACVDLHGATIRDIDGDGHRELYVLYRVDGGSERSKAFNLAAFALPGLELLWAATESFQSYSPVEASCFGSARLLDADCNGIDDIVILRTCHDTACPENDSADAECGGTVIPAHPRDIVYALDPQTRSYRAYRSQATRDVSPDCTDPDEPVIFCSPPDPGP